MSLEFMVPSLCIVAVHDMDYHGVLKAMLEKLLNLGE